eukprot:2355812-Amphidinium_carterae.1
MERAMETVTDMLWKAHILVIAHVRLFDGTHNDLNVDKFEKIDVKETNVDARINVVDSIELVDMH